MSLLPLLFSNWWEALDQPHRIFDQDFGLGINAEHLLSPTSTLQLYGLLPKGERNHSKCPVMANKYYCRPWGELLRKGEGGSSTVKAGKDKFEVVLDVQQFAPEEINVKVVDRHVIVEGQHEEKQDEHGWVSRQFTRKYLVPDQCDIKEVSSKLSSDGVLSIIVPRKREAIEGERVIDVVRTGQPAVRASVDETATEKKEEEEG